MKRRRRLRFGLLGLGQVGRNLIERHGSLRFDWVADSKAVSHRLDGAPLRKTDLVHIFRSKATKSTRSHTPGIIHQEYDSISQQINTLQSLILQPRGRWIIVDATYVDANSAYAMCNSMMGCLAYCGANKTAWADYRLCRKLYEQASRERTLLCLNCIQGVWLDQMEYVPAIIQNLKEGKLTIVKRDNPSLNLFYEKIWKNVSPSQAFFEIGKHGYLEPNASDLLAEVKDQWVKAKITTNFCSIMTKIKSQRAEQFQVDDLFSKLPKSAKPQDIANWHISNRKQGKYPALTSEILIRTNPPEIKSNLAFVNLQVGHPLARDFGGRNAFCVEAAEARFTWTNKNQPKRKLTFSHSGFGGARKTADKLMWEINRASRLSLMGRQKEFSPIPVVWGLEVGEAYANRVRRELSNQL